VFDLLMPRLAVLLAVLAAAWPPAALAGDARSADARLAARLASAMRGAGAYSGAYVVNSTKGGAVVFRWRERASRILASNTKLFTTAAALVRYGKDGTLGTEVRGQGTLEDGTWIGDLFLRGGGDPTFGSARFARRNYGAGASVEALAAKLDKLGIERVAGRVRGDEARFDSRRGTAATGWRTSLDLGPLSALAFNRGLATEGGYGFQSNPPAFAATRLHAALKRRGIKVSRKARAGRTPSDAEVLASVDSPPMSKLIRITNKPSDNYFAEMLLKDIALQVYGRGTTARGARLAAGFARRLGAGARLADGSGLSRADRASPYRVVRLLRAMQGRDEFPAFYDSLSIAGRDGTLRPRMRRGPARSRCRGKTGTLSNVSALSGYCRARSGDVYIFSILMNGVSPYGARAIQDRMAQAIAGVR
jgi:serine-type D-Ala-D-Ala carboxypeptidase/endopeptidase (penicillin-binding protein 4)